MKRPTRILYVSGTRADFNLMRNTLVEIQKSARFDVSVFVTGMHLRKKYGDTLQEITNAHLKIYASLDTLHKQDDPYDATDSIGLTISKAAQIFKKKKRPDIVFILGDRDEQLALTVTCAHLNMPIAHIHGGDLSDSIDQPNRHAITRYATVHFPACTDSAKRVLNMGEEKWRVFDVGSPAIEGLAKAKITPLDDLLRKYQIKNIAQPFVILQQYAVTNEYADSKRQIEETTKAVQKTGLSCLAFFPNSDLGAGHIERELKQFHKRNKNVHLMKSLTREDYQSFLKHAVCLIGNSSAGIIECSYLQVPVVNIGSRQSDRYYGKNVLHADYNAADIGKKIRWIIDNRNKMKTMMRKTKHIYGSGKVSSSIMKALGSIDLSDPQILKKKITY